MTVVVALRNPTASHPGPGTRLALAVTVPVFHALSAPAGGSSGCFETTMNRLVMAVVLVPAAAWAAAGPLNASDGVHEARHASTFADCRPDDEAHRADWREVSRIVEEAARTSARARHRGSGPRGGRTHPQSRVQLPRGLERRVLQDRARHPVRRDGAAHDAQADDHRARPRRAGAGAGGCGRRLARGRGATRLEDLLCRGGGSARADPPPGDRRPRDAYSRARPLMDEHAVHASAGGCRSRTSRPARPSSTSSRRRSRARSCSGSGSTAATCSGSPPTTSTPWSRLAVGQMHAIEFVAAAGDWAFHCHRSPPAMNATGHDVPTMSGVDLARAQVRWTQTPR